MGDNSFQRFCSLPREHRMDYSDQPQSIREYIIDPRHEQEIARQIYEERSTEPYPPIILDHVYVPVKKTLIDAIWLHKPWYKRVFRRFHGWLNG